MLAGAGEDTRQLQRGAAAGAAAVPDGSSNNDRTATVALAALCSSTVAKSTTHTHASVPKRRQKKHAYNNERRPATEQGKEERTRGARRTGDTAKARATLNERKTKRQTGSRQGWHVQRTSRDGRAGREHNREHESVSTASGRRRRLTALVSGEVTAGCAWIVCRASHASCALPVKLKPPLTAQQDAQGQRRQRQARENRAAPRPGRGHV